MPSNNSASDRGVKFEPLKNQAAIDFLKNKVPEVTKHWDDWLAPMHAHSFTIAGAPSVDFVKDMQAALVSNIEQGLTIADFRKKFDAIVKDYGWSYNDKQRGWRTKVIYQTNMRSARMAALWQQIQANKDVAPYLEYVAVMDSRTRPQHKAWDGTILLVDDDFWSTHYPPNGWNCRCTVTQRSQASLTRQGKSVSQSPKLYRRDVTNLKTGEVYHGVPLGVDVGFDSNVGQSWLAPDVAMGKKLAALPPLLAGHFYKNQVTPTFLKALDKQFSIFYDKSQAAIQVQKLTKQAPKFDPQFAGFLSPTIQSVLSVEHGIQLDNLSIETPHYQLHHLTGKGRNKEASPLFVGELFRELPSLLHDYRVVLLDKDGSLIFVSNKKLDNGRVVKIVVKPNYSDRRNNFVSTNQVTSMSLVNQRNLTQLNLPVVDGSW